jgi:hypothetical protein
MEKRYPQVENACDVLEHYHREHTGDVITRFRSDADGADIYITADPEWKEKLTEFTKHIFPVPMKQ